MDKRDKSAEEIVIELYNTIAELFGSTQNNYNYFEIDSSSHRNSMISGQVRTILEKFLRNFFDYVELSDVVFVWGSRPLHLGLEIPQKELVLHFQLGKFSKFRSRGFGNSIIFYRKINFIAFYETIQRFFVIFQNNLKKLDYHQNKEGFLKT